MTEREPEYATLWRKVKEEHYGSLTARDYNMYWAVNAAIESIAREKGVAADAVRDVLGSAPDGWDPDAV